MITTLPYNLPITAEKQEIHLKHKLKPKFLLKSVAKFSKKNIFVSSVPFPKKKKNKVLVSLYFPESPILPQNNAFYRIKKSFLVPEIFGII